MRIFSLLACLCCVSTGFAQKDPNGSSDPKVLKGMEREWTSAQAAFAMHPTDPKAKQRYVIAGVRYGHESMMSPILTPHVKYSQALHIYKQVLKVDPTNPVAKKEADLMIRIYKSMGRKVPD